MSATYAATVEIDSNRPTVVAIEWKLLKFTKSYDCGAAAAATARCVAAFPPLSTAASRRNARGARCRPSVAFSNIAQPKRRDVDDIIMTIV